MRASDDPIWLALEAAAGSHPRHRAEVVDARVGRPGVDDLRELIFCLLDLAGEIRMNAPAVHFGHLAAVLGVHTGRQADCRH
jgi:hypothetical protein